MLALTLYEQQEGGQRSNPPEEHGYHDDQLAEAIEFGGAANRKAHRSDRREGLEDGQGWCHGLGEEHGGKYQHQNDAADSNDGDGSVNDIIGYAPSEGRNRSLPAQ